MATDFTRGIKVYLDSQQYSKSMTEMTARLNKYREQLRKLTEEGKSDSKEADKLRSSIERLDKVEKRYNEELAVTERTLRNLSGASYNDLLQARKRLQTQLRSMSPQEKGYNDLLQTLIRTQTRLTAVTNEQNGVIQESRSLFSRASSVLNKYFLAVTTVITSVFAFITAGHKAVEAFTEVEEHLAKIRKYAGLTQDEARELSETLTHIDTRTAHTALLELAADAGRLGIKGVENLTAFVTAADKINLSLGEDLGKDAITNIGKLANLFGEDKRLGLEAAMLSTASAVTKLAKSSTACEPYLVNFAARLGGIGSVANIATGDILGIGSALDQNMQQVEMSSTAISTLITKMFQDPARYAKLAGIEVERFTELVKNDANEALLQFLTMMNDKGGFDALAPMFKDMQMDGKRAIQVLSTLASHVDQVREAQEIANQAYAENTEVEHEFSIINDTVQARLEKRRKQLQDLRVELGEKLLPVLVHIKTTQGVLVRLLKTLVDFFIEYKTTIVSVTAALGWYYVAAKKEIIIEKSIIALRKLHVFWNRTLTTTFVKMWNVVKANPWGALIAVLGVLITTLTKVRDRAREAADTMRSIDRLRSEAVNSVQGEITHVKALLAVLADENSSYEARVAAINEMKSISPEYLGSIDAEKLSYDNVAAAVQRYVTAIQLRAQIEKALAEKQDLTDQLGAIDEKIDKYNDPSVWQRLKEHVLDIGNFIKNGFSATFSYRVDGDTLVQPDNILDETITRTLVDKYNRSPMRDKSDVESQIAELDKLVEQLTNDLTNLEAKAVTSPLVTAPGATVDIDAIKEQYEGPGGVIETLNDKYSELEDRLSMSLARREISEEEYNVRVSRLHSEHYGALLAAYNEYATALSMAQASKESERESAVNAAHKKALKAERDFQKSVISTQDAFFKAVDALRKLGVKAEPDAYDKIEQEYGQRLQLANDYYAAIKAYIVENVTDINVALTMMQVAMRTYNEQVDTLIANRDAAIADQHLKDLKERNRTVSKYVQTSIKDQYQMELEELDAYHEKGLLSEQEYQRARNQLAFNAWMKGYEKIQSAASEMVQSLQQAEIDAVTAKYEVLIREAENNSEDTEQLERDQANAKLEIQKKYALSNLLVKLSQITADTAVAIMTGFSQLGPAAGAVAAAMLAATGAAQYASAFAEYNKVKSISLESSPSGAGGSTVVAERVVQYADGRYDVIGASDGRRYNDVPYIGTAMTGVVQRPALISESGAELIISAPDLRRLRSHVNYQIVADAINDARTGRVPQHAAGNYSQLPTKEGSHDGDIRLLALLEDIAVRIDTLPREIRSYVLLSDLNKATELDARARDPFKRADRNNGNKN